jgi:hypothetical protein
LLRKGADWRDYWALCDILEGRFASGASVAGPSSAINKQVKPFEKTVVGRPERWLVEAAKAAGLDISGLAHEVTDNFVAHCKKQHGNAEVEKARGQLPIASADIELIPDIVKNPDCVIIGIKKYGQTFNAYLKKEGDGAVIYYEEVLNSKKNKALRSKTMYKKMGKVSDENFLKIVSNNANTDVSGTKMVVGAGGNPGGEAE